MRTTASSTNLRVRPAAFTLLLRMFLIAFALVAHPAGSFAQSTLVGHWKLDEQSGLVASDSSGAGHNGNLYSGVSWIAEGVRDGGADFPGTSHIRVPHAASLLSPNALTIAAWVYLDSPTGNQNAVQKGKNYALWEIRNGGTPYNVLYIGEWRKFNYSMTAAEFVGGWHHVAFTYDGTKVVNYLDGEIDGVYAQTGTVETDTKWLGIGVNGDWNDSPFQGKIDDVRIYDGALTPSEISQIHGLLGHWKFDEGTGATAADSTASANDATLQAGATWTSDCLGEAGIEFNGLGANAITASSFSPPLVGSVAFWMRSAGLPAARSRIFGLGGNWETRQEPDGTLSFDLGGEGPPEFVSAASLGEEDRWYHVAAVFDAADDTFQVYIDGQPDNSGINGDDMVAQSTGKLSFGTRTGNSEYWKGALKDFRIYAIKLTASEVAQLYGSVAHWKLDELSGTVAVDSSGRGNDATYVGSPTLGGIGAYPLKTNTSLTLDGSTQHVEAGTGLLNQVEEFTISGWFNPSSVSPVISFVGQHDLIELGIDTSYNQIEFWTNQGGAINAVYFLSPGKWKHIAAVGNGTSLTLYVDGREVATGGSSTINYGSNSEAFKIGEGVMDSADGHFEGRIDDVRVYDRALCAGQVYDLYKGGRPNGVRILKWIEVR